MWNEPSLEELSQLPSIADALKKKPGKRIVHMHFVAGSDDWYAVAYDPSPAMLYCCHTSGDPERLVEWGRWPWFTLTEYKNPYRGNIEIARNANWEPVQAYEDTRLWTARFVYGKEESKGDE